MVMTAIVMDRDFVLMECVKILLILYVTILLMFMMKQLIDNALIVVNALEFTVVLMEHALIVMPLIMNQWTLLKYAQQIVIAVV